jgi:hypothetical protein
LPSAKPTLEKTKAMTELADGDVFPPEKLANNPRSAGYSFARKQYSQLTPIN